MSLKRKIVLGFLLSASGIAILVLAGYINFHGIRREIRHLELSDTVRGLTLQIRRHEKNFLLYGDPGAVSSVYKALDELGDLLEEARAGFPDVPAMKQLDEAAREYRLRFDSVRDGASTFHEHLDSIGKTHSGDSLLIPIIEIASLERPPAGAKLLKSRYGLRDSDPMLANLLAMNGEITALRKAGEDLLVFSQELDRRARERAESGLSHLQVEVLFLFPVVLFVGIGASLVISLSVVSRLRILSEEIERTGKGHTQAERTGPRKRWGKDEVGMLLRNFHHMAEQLADRERELLQTKKLAAIGTLASGVAHELNNPLNNIYTTAQRLTRKSGGDCPAFIRSGLEDIFGETLRVKDIVTDLLEFARGREPQYRNVNMVDLVRGAYRLIAPPPESQGIHLTVRTEPENPPEGRIVTVDPKQLERVFINLFSNAVAAMPGGGELTVVIGIREGIVSVKIADTGRGIPAEHLEKIFEPFFTTRDKGTGLGLAIVFNIIRRHGGDIRVESEEGRGTTFTITLPVKPETEKAVS